MIKKITNIFQFLNHIEFGVTFIRLILLFGVFFSQIQATEITLIKDSLTRSNNNCILLLSGHPDSKFCQQQLKHVVAQTKNVFPGKNMNIVTGQRVGGIFAAYQNDLECYISCGYKDLNFKKRLNEHSVLEIASVTKTFTATILGVMQVQKKLNSLDFVKPNLPLGFTFASNEMNVTYQQLATFSGGFSYSDPPNAINPSTTTFPQSSFEDDINNLNPAEPPSTTVYTVNPPQYLPTVNVYSNSSYGLLGQVLANIHYPGVAFNDAVLNALYCDFILNPLRMSKTNVCTPLQTKNRRCTSYNSICKSQSGWLILMDFVPGYRINNTSHIFESAPFFPYQPWAAAGSLRSTALDMMKYMKMILGVTNTPDLTDGANLGLSGNYYLPIPQGQKARINHPAPNSPAHQGWAWVVLPANANKNPNQIQFKLGGHAGFNSFIGVDMTLGYAIVILTNTGPDHKGRVNPNVDSNLQRIGVNIMVETALD
ncbi:beta-lactamase family protein [Thiotrichales bacterium 19X7-9]|nr:beta-lactamase family protein [Thiotrichales bacterium 19X7-9]